MQETKVPTLSIGPKKPKVFGKPNQSPKLTLTTQKSPSSASKSPSVTPKKAKSSMSSGFTTPTNLDSSKKQEEPKNESNYNNSEIESNIENDIKSQKSTPSRRKDSNVSLHSDRDRASVISVSSVKKSNKQKNLSGNSNKQEFEQNNESLSINNSELDSEITTPERQSFTEKNGKANSILSSSSAKKSQQKQNQVLVDSPANSTKQTTTPTSQKINAVSSSKSDSKNSISSTKKPKASTPNEKNNLKQNKKDKNNNRTISTEDDSYDYSPANSPKRRRSPQKNNGPLSPIVKDIIPLVKSLLVNNNDKQNDNTNENNESNKEAIIDEYKMSNVAEQLEEWQKTIVSQASPIEEAQIQLWYDSIIELFKQQNFFVVEKPESNQENTESNESSQQTTQNIDFLDEIINNARGILQNHRFSFTGGYDHRLKLIITGPNKSGKSTYLSILAQQLLFELIACGDWKKNFIFPINFSNIAHACQDLGQLFIEMAKLSIQALCAQRPLLIKYCTSLTESFTAVVNGKPSLPRTFVLDEDFRLIAPQVQQVLDICYECYHDSQAMTSFTANACMLPYFIANAFGGFSNVIVIADHFDLSDVTKTASQPFEDSPDNVFIAEIYKYLLMQTSFIIGAKYESALNEVLTSLDVQNASFAQGIEFLTTYNIINKKQNKTDSAEEEEESDDNNELVFNVSFNGINENLTVVEDMFEGCPIYLSKFNIVRKIAQKIENGQKLEDEKLSSSGAKDIDIEEIDVEEEKLKLVIKMEELLRLTMISQDGSPYDLHANAVTFKHKGKKQKKTEKKTESEN